MDEEISTDIFTGFLEYLYTGDENIIQPENAIDLMQVADRFMSEDFKLLIESFIVQV
jgi:hypothetical protein